jgi:hypothetical protein
MVANSRRLEFVVAVQLSIVFHGQTTSRFEANFGA